MLSNIATDIQTYVSEMVIKFIMGIEPLNKYGEFVDTLNNKMGVPQGIEIYQKAYDRYKNR